MRTSAIGALVVTVTVGLTASGCASQDQDQDQATDPEVAGSSEGSAQVVSSPGTAAQVPPSSHTVTGAEFDRWKTELSNWGRWGADDEIGALNLITPEKRKQAAALVQEGVSVSLSRDADLEEGRRGGAPYQRIMNQVGPTGAADRLAIRYHGYVVTHLDAFGHRFFDGKMWNGFSHEEITEENGATKNSIYNLKNGIFTRGILMDIPRLKGVEYLEAGTRIYPEDLEAWEQQAGVRVSAGDAVFIRTGRWARIDQLGASRPVGGEPGLDPSVIPWLKNRDVALLGSEQAQDAAAVGDMPGLAVHDFALVVLGIHLFDNCRLDAVAEAAAAQGRWEFLLTAAPLAVPGGTGSPLKPIATF